MDELIIKGQTFSNRLLVGTGKYASPEIMAKSLSASGTQIVTTAIRRVDLNHPEDPFIRHISPDKYCFVPNTSGARNAEEAIRLARIGRASGLSDWVKLEVTPEPNYLLPDPIETLKAAEVLVKEGFIVLPYIQADPILAKRLEEVGCATVMPLAAPIGTNLGLQTKMMIQMIIEQSQIPVIVDAGLGTPSHAAEAMEMGADAVLMNTAIATAKDPIMMAHACRLAVEAGRLGYLAGQAVSGEKANASSPLTGFLFESHA